MQIELLTSELIETLSAVGNTSNLISEQAILVAIRNENACTPWFRTTSQITLQIATEQNATRVELLREGIYRLQ